MTCMSFTLLPILPPSSGACAVATRMLPTSMLKSIRSSPLPRCSWSLSASGVESPQSHNDESMTIMNPDRSASPAISLWSDEEPPLGIDPSSSFWHDAPVLAMNFGPYGEPVPNHETRILSRWNAASLYFLFVCQYLDLHLKPEPVVHTKQQQLWNWDVAEVFIGSCSDPIWRYKEFQVSPQGESA